MRFINRTIGNMAGIWITAHVMTGISVRHGESWGYTLLYLFVVAAALTAINYFIRPIVKFLAFPLYILTLGLFSVVVNGMMFGLTGWLSTSIHVPLIVNDWGSAIWGGTLTAIISSILTGMLNQVLPSNGSGGGSSRR